MGDRVLADHLGCCAVMRKRPRASGKLSAVQSVARTEVIQLCERAKRTASHACSFRGPVEGAASR